MEVFVDGACRRNGAKDAVGGIGIYFPDLGLEISERFGSPSTNNQAEIRACIRAVEIAKERDIRHILIRTDSSFVFNSVTKWIYQWRKNGWKKVNGLPVINQTLFKAWLTTIKGGITIDVSWIPREKNKMADTLAKAGAADS